MQWRLNSQSSPANSQHYLFNTTVIQLWRSHSKALFSICSYIAKFSNKKLCWLQYLLILPILTQYAGLVQLLTSRTPSMFTLLLSIMLSCVNDINGIIKDFWFEHLYNTLWHQHSNALNWKAENWSKWSHPQKLYLTTVAKNLQTTSSG